jgi:hypothetical protein
MIPRKINLLSRGQGVGNGFVDAIGMAKSWVCSLLGEICPNGQAGERQIDPENFPACSVVSD